MVERVTDTVTCMDPYPWDDLDEEYTLPLVEFMVRWELAGGESILFKREACSHTGDMIPLGPRPSGRWSDRPTATPPERRWRP